MLILNLLSVIAVVSMVQCTSVLKPKFDTDIIEYSVKDKKLVFYDHALGKTHEFFYVTCDDPTAQNKMNCEFSLANHGSLKHTFTCNVNINAPANREVYRHLRVERFEIQSVLYAWSEYEASTNTLYHKYSTIYMPECQVEHTEETIGNGRGVDLMTYRVEYDVFFNDKSKSCGSEVCRLNHGQGGLPVTDSIARVPSSVSFWGVRPLSIDYSDHGFIGFSENKVFYVKSSGESKELLTIPADSFHVPNLSNERLGLCYPLNDDENVVQCLQSSALHYEPNLSFPMNTTITLNKNERIVSLFNTNVHGMLLFTGSDCTDKFNFFTCEKFSAFKVHNNGKQEQRVDVPKPNFGCQPKGDTISVDITGSQGTYGFHFAGICDDKIKWSRSWFSDNDFYSTLDD